MKSTVEQLSPTRVRINVEVPFDELKPSFDRAYRKLAQQVRIPGFRPGKAPARVLESRIGRAPVLDEVVNEAIPAKYGEAVTAGEVRPLGQPDIEVTKLEDGELLAFTAEVDVRPKIELPAFDGITVTVDDVEVTDEDVDKQLDELRARFGTLVGVERPVQQGDFVVLDLSATVDGEDVPDARTTGLSYEVGSGQLVEGIDDALVGAAEGETRSFTTTLVAGEHAGKQAEVSAVVTSVKERQLPEADDEFAQLASEFDTLDELKADLRERLGRVKRMQQAMQARDKVLEALLEAAEVPLPEKVVESEVGVRKHDAVHPFDHDEARFAQWLESQGQTLEDFEKEAREDAERAVKTQLLLDAIADAEELGVTDQELTERIVYQAQRFGISPDEYVQRAQQAGQLGVIFADVRRGKALGVVVRQATVTDASGATVDLSDLFGEEQGGKDESGAESAEAGQTEQK
ncbi:trigger factor [Streptoalloteichus tenebrarius]|uniref:Trigger factor n=1 Tax=Streptoalloteichus tenebrarius (strain ATCC 17920 / DSM 40477 / JCM 4838 / CBS 697.72 / NBRC 16177 / NCIMB 11028 / NRRL B-12390 / A12253. 1 / ISP 5477) TaxID=1933 RepID=A0ABT1HX73_STRSD|nr:trigger factor [Streptoalloteichus tenebrarius]MCP2260110.1 trigger factor [Streptoalloteichus tenebrarius]BFF00570.1 trigger factor [Streptoalloteichus tenebrarius]